VNQLTLQPITPEYDPWDPIRSLRKHGKHVLTSVELTTTHLCNMRCEHCAVGDALTTKEAAHLPVADMLRMLDQVEHLETLSITGGEPSYDADAVREYVLPLLKYARERGVRTQINSNLTMPVDRYEMIAPWLDVMHISYNYRGAEDFWDIGFAKTTHTVSIGQATKMFDRMIDNVRKLSAGGLYISAESMINYRTHEHLVQMHEAIVAMGCRRHEVHPMYPSAFAGSLPVLSLTQMRDTIHTLLDKRDPSIWMLFGTLPFFACSSVQEDRELWWRLQKEANVTVRNDPDGRNRLNVDTFSGKVSVTDFAELTQIASIMEAPYELDRIFEEWQQHEIFNRLNCYCSSANCCGPNLLVADTYYPNIDFKARTAKDN
jgi:radical SAM/CxCxxxxC motif protein YfkAB